jgi:hypothetical protein
MTRWETFPRGYYVDAFVPGAELAASSSWDQTALREWHADVEEVFDETVGAHENFKLRAGATSDEVRKSIAFGIRQILRLSPSIRRRAVEWDVTEPPSSLPLEPLRRGVRLIWNGMRRLPYDSDDIAEACGVFAALIMLGLGQTADMHKQEEIASHCFGPVLDVGFSYADQSGSRGFASRMGLVGALREDLSELLRPEHRDRAGDPQALFRVNYNPSLLFEFIAFKRIFAREVIPTQAAKNRQLLVFNPARLVIFGNP